MQDASQEKILRFFFPFTKGVNTWRVFFSFEGDNRSLGNVPIYGGIGSEVVE